MAKSLEDSDYTAVQARIEKTLGKTTQLPLVPFEDETAADQTALPYYLRHYLARPHGQRVDKSGFHPFVA